MLGINPYLNFNGNAEQAFLFYQSVFGGEFISFQRFSDIPDLPGSEMMSESQKNGMMHIGMPLGNTIIMATDVIEGIHPKAEGNNFYLSINAESKEEADKLFTALSDGAEIEMPLQDTFWNAYFGMLKDKFGIRWMFNYDYPAAS